MSQSGSLTAPGGERIYRGLLETKRLCKKSLKTAKLQNRKKFHPKLKTIIKVLTHKALVVFRISLSVINFYMYKLILLSEVVSGYSLVNAEQIVV